MSWTPPDQIALDLNDCEQLGLLLWHESAPSDFDAAEYLLATHQRRAAGAMKEALDRMTAAYLEIAELRGEGDLSWMPCVQQARAALAKAEGKEG